jgi:AhpD family alkylhydroperoxidase
MARLPIARPHGIDLLRRLMYAFGRRMYGQLPEPAGVIAHHRPLLAGYSAIGLAHMRYSRAVPRRLKELAMLRSAQLIGCEWCLDFGSRLAADAGVPEEHLRELAVWRNSNRFDELDRLVLEYTEQMTRTPVEVSDELFGRLAEHFDEAALVELTMTIALENLYSRSNWALGIEGQGFSEGSYCVMPEHGSGALVGDSMPR